MKTEKQDKQRKEEEREDCRRDVHRRKGYFQHKYLFPSVHILPNKFWD